MLITTQNKNSNLTQNKNFKRKRLADKSEKNEKTKQSSKWWKRSIQANKKKMLIMRSNVLCKYH